MSWEKVKLGDISLNIQTGPFGSQLHQYDYSETGIPVVMPKDLVGGKISELSIARVSEDHVQRLKRHVIHNGDILYSRRGDVGRCAFATEHEKGWLCGTGCLRVTVDTRIASNKFVFYQLQQPKTIGWVEKHAIGATMLNLNTTILSNIPVCLPPIKIQRRIYTYIYYDDLIENNRKQIKLLEEAAQRLYKEWFVNLRFPGHEHTKITDTVVPEGWGKCSLGDVIEFDPKVQLTKDRIKQFAPLSALSTSSMVLDMAEFSETTSNLGSKFQNGDTLLARITPCLENGKTAFVHGIQSAEGAVGSTEYIVMRSKRLNPYMVYLHARTDGFRQAAINSMSGSDGRQRVKADKLKVLSCLLPPATVVNQFGQFAAPIFELVFDLNEQTFHAAQARDRLLPRFMSGLLQV